MKSRIPKSVFENLENALRSLETIVKGGVPAISYSTQGSSVPSNVLSSMGKTPSIPMFKGNSSREFMSWLFEVECYFSEHVLAEEEKYDLVVPCLKDHACLWHNTLQLSMALRGNRKIRTWSELRGVMREKFLPFPVVDNLTLELRNLRQTSLNVNEYAKLFEELHLACDESVDCVQKGVRFYHGLNARISDQIELSMKYSFTEMYHLALLVEMGLGDKKLEDSNAKILIIDKEVHLETLGLSNINSDRGVCESECVCEGVNSTRNGLGLNECDMKLKKRDLTLVLASDKSSEQTHENLIRGENPSPFTIPVEAEIKMERARDDFHEKGVVKGVSSKCNFPLLSHDDLKMFNDEIESGKDKFQQEHTYCSSLKIRDFDAHNLNLSEKPAELLHEEKGLNPKKECEGERRSNVIMAGEDWSHKGMTLYQIDQGHRGTPNQPKEPCMGYMTEPTNTNLMVNDEEMIQGMATLKLKFPQKENKVAELRNVTPQLTPFTILIYDPGGNSKTPSSEVVFKLLQRLNLLKLQGDAPIRVGDYLSSINKGNSKMSLWLCANSEYGDGFQEGEDAAGAHGFIFFIQRIISNTTNMPKKSQSQTTHKRSKPQLIAQALLKPSYGEI